MARVVHQEMRRQCSRGTCRAWVAFGPSDYIADDTGLAPSGVKCLRCGKRIPVLFAELPPSWQDEVWKENH